MDMDLFTNRVTRNPQGHLKYLILEGTRTGWVLPGNMLLTETRGPNTLLTESALPINPAVGEGDTVVPLKMHESRVWEYRVQAVRTGSIQVDGDMRHEGIT